MSTTLKLTHKIDTVTGLSAEFTCTVLEAFRNLKDGKIERDVLSPVLAIAFDKCATDAPDDTVIHTVVGEIIGATIINNLPKALTGESAILRIARCQFDSTPDPLAPPADAVPQVIEVPSNTTTH